MTGWSPRRLLAASPVVSFLMRRLASDSGIRGSPYDFKQSARIKSMTWQDRKDNDFNAVKTHRITTSKTHGQRTQEWTQGIPLRGLGATWTCEAGGSLYRGGGLLATGCLSAPWELRPLAPPHAAVADNIITAGARWCNPPQRPRSGYPSRLFSHRNQILSSIPRCWLLVLRRDPVRDAGHP